MTSKTRVLLAFVLTLAFDPAWAQSSVVIKNGAGANQSLGAFALPDGSLAPKHVEISPLNGLPFTMLNGQPVAPAIAAGYPVDRSGTIAVAGTAQTVMVANSIRKSGYVQADPRNTDLLSVSITGTATTAPGAPNQCVLTPGGVCPLVLNGYVVQTQVTVNSATAGVGFSAVEVQ